MKPHLGKPFRGWQQMTEPTRSIETTSRRTALKLLGAATLLGGGLGTVSADHLPSGYIQKLGQSLLGVSSPGEFAEASVSDDGQYAVVGSFFGERGSFLVDLSDPTNPTKVHQVPSNTKTRNADIKFDPRDGVYYRTQEKNAPDGNFGVEIIDYGFDRGSPTDPEIVARIEAANETHNVVPHPDPSVGLLYAVNEYHDDPGVEVWDVSTPSRPRKVRNAGPLGGLHDVVVDPNWELMHCAYIHTDGPKALEGYAILDVSNPRRPVELGRFDYTEHPDYTEPVGTEGFENCHYADYDPENPDLVIVGDEKGSGLPGGKHLFDTSDPTDPQPIDGGFFVSPHAEKMDEEGEGFDWTGHNFDVIPASASPTGGTLLVSGDYHEGTVVYDIDDPSSPEALDRYETDDREAQAPDPIFPLGSAPMAWDADYNAAQDIVVTSDMVTGVYVFRITAPS